MSLAAPLRSLPLRKPAAPVAEPRPRPNLTVVAPRPATAGRVPFVVAVVTVLVGGLVSLLMLHTLAAQDAFTLHALQGKAAQLGDQEQALALANQQAQAPTELAARAAAVGMVPATSVSVTTLHGRPAAVLSAPPVPPPAATPSPSASGTRTATATASTAAKPGTKPTTGPATKPTTKPSTGATAGQHPKPAPSTHPHH